MTPKKRQILLILTALALVVCLDQITKTVVIRYIDEGTFVPAAKGPKFFQFTHQRNYGLVNGMFSTQPKLAYAAPFVATLVLLYLYRHLDVPSKVQAWAYGMIGGGAIGNLIDRVRLGSVTDFLQFHFHFIPFNFPWKYYPAFNVADSAICVGVFLLVVSWYAAGTPPKNEAHAVHPV